MNQHVIDSLPSGLATTDPHQRILTFNRAAEAITGVPFRSAVGRPIGEVLQLPAELADGDGRRPDERAAAESNSGIGPPTAAAISRSA